MNANELADMAENACCAYQKEISAMLRQQQAEIEALKMDIHSLTYGERIAKYFNKPVAWMKTLGDGTIYGFGQTKTNDELDIPLYTHPAKEPYNNAVGKTIEGGAELVCDWDIDVNKWITTVKTLTNDEILCLWDYWSGEILAIDILDFADKYRRAILNEEGIIEWHQEYCKKMNEEDAKKVDTYKSQNNNQIDTYRYKNLTDAEIEQILKQHDWYSKTWVDMVRSIESAILRKAQEK